VSVTEAIGRWRPIPDDARTLVGRAHAGLGRGATLGRRFYAVEYDVGLSIRACTMDELSDLLPGGRAHRLLSEAATAVLPHHIDWRACVAIEEPAIRPARLGAARLGWTGWMAPRGRPVTRNDLTLRARPATLAAGEQVA
jgi:type VI secretion system protein ImpH